MFLFVLLAACPEPEKSDSGVVIHDSGPPACGDPEDGDGFCPDEGDCDNNNPDVNPAAEEICNGIDDNCDGVIDEGVEGTFYGDADRDGFGDALVTEIGCDASSGFVQNGEDCDDTSGEVYPGAIETCDGVDQDCSGSIDDGGVCPCDVVENGGVAYQFCDDVLTWADASATCAADGYHLVTVDDAAEDAWLVGEVATYASDLSWWIGYTDAAAEGTWRWEDGSTSSYTDWDSGEPDDFSDEDCAVLETHWDDVACANTSGFICEAGYVAGP